jgi:phage-related holin
MPGGASFTETNEGTLLIGGIRRNSTKMLNWERKQFNSGPQEAKMPDGVGAAFLWVFKGAAASLSAVWVSVPFAIKLLCLLSVIDIATGLFHSKKAISLQVKQLSLAIFFTISIHFVLLYAKNQGFFNVGFDLASAVCLFYVMTELISIVQNIDAAGVPVPPQVLEFLEKAEGITTYQKKEVDFLLKKQAAEIEALNSKQKAEEVALKQKQEDVRGAN